MKRHSTSLPSKDHVYVVARYDGNLRCWSRGARPVVLAGMCSMAHVCFLQPSQGARRGIIRDPALYTVRWVPCGEGGFLCWRVRASSPHAC